MFFFGKIRLFWENFFWLFWLFLSGMAPRFATQLKENASSDRRVQTGSDFSFFLENTFSWYISYWRVQTGSYFFFCFRKNTLSWYLADWRVQTGSYCFIFFYFLEKNTWTDISFRQISCSLGYVPQLDTVERWHILSSFKF